MRANGFPPIAQDEVGKLAGEAATLMLRAAVELLRASRSHPRAERVFAVEDAFVTWPKIARLMADLERCAPNAAAEGQERGFVLADMAEVVRDRAAAGAGA